MRVSPAITAGRSGTRAAERRAAATMALSGILPSSSALSRRGLAPGDEAGGHAVVDVGVGGEDAHGEAVHAAALAGDDAGVAVDAGAGLARQAHGGGGGGGGRPRGVKPAMPLRSRGRTPV